jgi:hypothetical protein
MQGCDLQSCVASAPSWHFNFPSLVQFESEMVAANRHQTCPYSHFGAATLARLKVATYRHFGRNRKSVLQMCAINGTHRQSDRHDDRRSVSARKTTEFWCKEMPAVSTERGCLDVGNCLE